MKPKAIRIMLVDDHAVVRQGYRTLLEKHADIEVVAEADGSQAAYTLARQLQPDVIIMDLSMPGQSGVEGISRLRRALPQIRILVFTMHHDPLYATQAARAGSNGYITKSSSPETLVRAVYKVMAGEYALSADIAQALAVAKLNGNEPGVADLTVREFEIFQLLISGRSTDEIAALLHISPKTVCNCHYQIKSKLGARSDIDLVHIAMRAGVAAHGDGFGDASRITTNPDMAPTPPAGEPK